MRRESNSTHICTRWGTLMARLKGWEYLSIGDIATIDSGATPPPSDERGTFPIMGANGPIGRCSRSNFEFGYLVGRVGAAGAVNKVHGPIWASDNTLTVQPLLTVCDERFLGYLLKHLRLEQMSTKTAQPLVTQTQLRTLRCIAPIGVHEQCAIADVLEAIDEALRKTEQVIDKLQQMKQGLLHDLLTRGINENGDLREAGSRSAQFIHTAVGQVPAEWTMSPLGEVLDGIDAGVSPDCSDERPPQGQWGILKVSAVSSGLFKPNETKTPPSTFKPIEDLQVESGDLLCVRANGVTDLVGITALVNSTPAKLMLSDKTLRLKPCKAKATTAYLHLALQTPYVRSQVRGLLNGTSGQNNISQSQIRSLIVPVPPLKEQIRIGLLMESICLRIETEQLSKERLTNVKSGLQQDLLTGRVRVPVREEVHA